LNKKFERFGLEEMYNELIKVDPFYANKINKNDKKRVMRASWGLLYL